VPAKLFALPLASPPTSFAVPKSVTYLYVNHNQNTQRGWETLSGKGERRTKRKKKELKCDVWKS